MSGSRTKGAVSVGNRRLRSGSDLATLTVAGALALTGFFGFELLQAAPVLAAPCVQINRIYYNSPGSDTGTNTSLNGEWISLHNGCSTRRSLKGWTIKDAAGHKYTFGSYRLGGGKGVKVHTGKGTNTATDRYWGLSWYVWNNDKDTAYLRNSSGTLVDKCSYNNPSASSISCGPSGY
jgi:hypothetical protein